MNTDQLWIMASQISIILTIFGFIYVFQNKALDKEATIGTVIVYSIAIIMFSSFAILIIHQLLKNIMFYNFI